MEINHGLFDIKLQELNQNYSQIQRHIMLCQKGDQRKVLNEIQKITEEIKEDDRLLQIRIENSRSRIVSKLAAAQLDYSNKTKDILKINSLSSKESAALYAEFAIDFATQSIRQALLAALHAINIQFNEEKGKGEINE